MDGGNEKRGREKRRDKSSYSQCLSPRWLICRWLSKGKGGSLDSETRREKEEKGLRSRSLEGGDDQRQPSSPGVENREVSHGADVPGQHAKEDNSVNLGVGIVLCYLIAESKNELNKMIDLRREMEVLIHSARNEFDTRKSETLYEPSVYNNHACSTIDTYESLHSNSIHNLLLENQSGAPISSSCDQSLMINSTIHEKCAEGIDQLEAQLESELELLEVRFGNSDYPMRQNSKVPVDNRSSEGRSSPSYTKADDVLEGDSSEQYGVCPRELERRLHELIQSRQQKRIEELEAALQCANQKLVEKEKEVSWLRDTTRIFSRHVPEASRLSRLGRAFISS